MYVNKWTKRRYYDNCPSSRGEDFLVSNEIISPEYRYEWRYSYSISLSAFSYFKEERCIYLYHYYYWYRQVTIIITSWTERVKILMQKFQNDSKVFYVLKRHLFDGKSSPLVIGHQSVCSLPTWSNRSSRSSRNSEAFASEFEILSACFLWTK